MYMYTVLDIRHYLGFRRTDADFLNHDAVRLEHEDDRIAGHLRHGADDARMCRNLAPANQRLRVRLLSAARSRRRRGAG